MNPLLAIADRLREREPDAEVLVLGTAEGLEARLVPVRGYELLTIPRLPFPRRPNGAALRFPGRWTDSVERTRAIIRDRGVDVVVGFGGYAAAPAYRAAHREGMPLAIHEANAQARASRTARRAVHAASSASPSRPRASAARRVVGMPLRREIEHLDRFAVAPGGARGSSASTRAGPPCSSPAARSGARRLNEGVSRSDRRRPRRRLAGPAHHRRPGAESTTPDSPATAS